MGEQKVVYWRESSELVVFTLVSAAYVSLEYTHLVCYHRSQLVHVYLKLEFRCREECRPATFNIFGALFLWCKMTTEWFDRTRCTMASQVTKIARIGAIQSVKAKLKLSELEPQGEKKCHSAYIEEITFCSCEQSRGMTLMPTTGIGRKRRPAVAQRHRPCPKSSRCGSKIARCRYHRQEKFWSSLM